MGIKAIGKETFAIIEDVDDYVCGATLFADENPLSAQFYMKAYQYSCDDDMEKQFFTAEHVKFRDDDVCSACGKKDGEFQIPEDVKQQHKKVFGTCESCKTAGRH